MNKRKFLLATQYYRAPTPLPAEWEDDLRNIKKLGFEAIQLRIQWRWNERKEGVYNFDDIDGLLDTAKKNNLDVIIKFMLETAPEYIYRKYNGYRLSPDGTKIFPIAHGAFYVGGWLPCFDNPLVREHGSAFISEVVKRYGDRENLILYNAWNEPRSRPGTECACEYSRRSYQDWLRERFSTIEELNGRYGKAWGDFEDVAPPSDTKDYVEMYLWRQWAAFSVKERVKWVTGKIKEFDAKRPVMCHVGMCLPYQDVLNDTSDDLLNAGEVDIYGTSLPHWAGEFHGVDRITGIASFDGDRRNFYIVNLIPDWIRGVAKDFYSYEIYTNSFYYSVPDFNPEDLKFYLYSQVAAGAKGLCLWQYKPERFGNESICSGLVTLDGGPTDRSIEVGKILEDLKAQRKILENYEVDRSKLAIVYDFRSDITSRMEETNSGDWRKETSEYLYKKSFKGAYRGFFLLNILPDLIDIRQLLDTCLYPFLYLPAPFILNKKEAELFKRYVEAGGTLITENCLGFRDDNTWMRTSSFPYGLDEVFGIGESIPKKLKDRLKLGDITLDVDDVVSCYETREARVLGRWEKGNTAVTINEYGKGKAVAIGFHPGLLANTEIFLKCLCEKIGLYPEHAVEGKLIVRQGRSGNKRVFFLFNYGDCPQKTVVGGREIEVGARDIREVILEETAETENIIPKEVSYAV